MKILVTGGGGQLGREVARQGRGHELVLTDHSMLDITDRTLVSSYLRLQKPQAVIHCAAYTNVDGAEAEPDRAFQVNVTGAQNIAAGCLEIGARLIYISTDYVFDGLKQAPYREFDAAHPLNVYGMTKWQGEEIVRRMIDRHYILRTAWLFGDGHNFVRAMLRLGSEQQCLRVVHDQVGTPTSCIDVTRAIFTLLSSDAYGTYHATCRGQCSWYEFACEIFRLLGRNVTVLPVSTADFIRPARRPVYSVLDNHMLRMTVGDPMREWQEALREYLMLSER